MVLPANKGRSERRSVRYSTDPGSGSGQLADSARIRKKGYEWVNLRDGAVAYFELVEAGILHPSPWSRREQIPNRVVVLAVVGSKALSLPYFYDTQDEHPGKKELGIIPIWRSIEEAREWAEDGGRDAAQVAISGEIDFKSLQFVEVDRKSLFRIIQGSAVRLDFVPAKGRISAPLERRSVFGYFVEGTPWSRWIEDA